MAVDILARAISFRVQKIVETLEVDGSTTAITGISITNEKNRFYLNVTTATKEFKTLLPDSAVKDSQGNIIDTTYLSNITYKDGKLILISPTKLINEVELAVSDAEFKIVLDSIFNK